MKFQTFSEFLNESKYFDEAKLIRKILKGEYKLTSRDVSVKMYSQNVQLTIKSSKAIPHYVELLNVDKYLVQYANAEKTDQEFFPKKIYIEIEFDDKIEEKIVEIITDEIKNSAITKNYIMVYDEYEIMVSGDKYLNTFDKKVSAEQIAYEILSNITKLHDVKKSEKVLKMIAKKM